MHVEGNNQEDSWRHGRPVHSNFRIASKVKEPITISEEEVARMKSLVEQILASDNPVTTSSLKHILAKRVAKVLGYSDKELIF
jgi:hypothetical protein